jgi:hypothetical protein
MSETFTLNILYKGALQEIVCTLRTSAYTYQFLCATGNAEIILEKDDEGKLRAMGTDPFSNKNKNPEPGLVRALMDEMERILQ